LAIARGLLDNACNVNKIVRALKVKQSSVSQHLKIMKNAGIIRGERQGVRICYRIISAKAIKIIKGGM
ncbi:transcriptional regulator, partial [candidate division WOR-1 bacterium RIFOXYB2_FULL_48_7]